MNLVHEFFRHNTMMNRRVLEACRQLSPEQLSTTVPGTYGSIATTLVHISNAQLTYASRLLGSRPPQPLAEDPFPGFPALEERFSQGDAWLEQASARIEDRELELRDSEGNRALMPAPLLLLQAINHGTEHRSQVATILTQLGIVPPEMDGWTYFVASGQLIDV